MPHHPLYGIFAPAISPLDAQGDLDTESLERHLEFLVSGGVQGLWMNGTSGDFHATSPEDAAAAVGLAVGVARARVPIIAHVGDTASGRMLDRVERALDGGADAVSLITPYYMDYSISELHRHIALASAAAGGPVFLYQHPATGKPALPAETIVAWAREGLVQGIKESGRDFEYFSQLVELARDEGTDLRVFHGSGAWMQRCLDAGAAGMVSVIANLVPAACARLIAAHQAGDRPTVDAIQADLCALTDAILAALSERTTWAPTIAAYKFLLRERGIISCDRVPEPLEPLRSAEIEHLLNHALPMLDANWRRWEAVGSAP